MSAFTRMADSYEEVEAENGQLHMQVRKLKAQNAELLAALVMAESAMIIAQALEKIPPLLGEETWRPGILWSHAQHAIAKAKGGE